MEKQNVLKLISSYDKLELSELGVIELLEENGIDQYYLIEETLKITTDRELNKLDSYNCLKDDFEEDLFITLRLFLNCEIRFDDGDIETLKVEGKYLIYPTLKDGKLKIKSYNGDSNDLEMSWMYVYLEEYFEV